MKEKEESRYDYSRLISSAKKESQYESFSDFIHERINEYREKYCDGEARKFTRSHLANELDLDLDTVTKIINGRQNTRKRDVIIAICFVLRMSVSEAQLALNLYPVASLNQNNVRDLVMIQALRDGLSLKELKIVLEAHRLAPLNLSRQGGRKDERAIYVHSKSSEYEEVTVEVEPYSIAEDDYSVSLHERYSPTRYDYYGEMIVRKINSGSKYRITYGELGYSISLYDNEIWKELYTDDVLSQKWDNLKACEDLGLLDELSKLKEYVDLKARYIHSMCADTRNYGVRFSAENQHGKLIVYGESFNYDSPELCEYYQVELSSDTSVFSMSHDSRFLERYLGKDTWKKMYGTTLLPVNESFRQIEEIRNKKMLNQFQYLLGKASIFLDELRQRKLFMSNARAWMDVTDIMHMYKVEEKFGCEKPYYYNGLTVELFPKKQYFIGADGKRITIGDLYRAAELDIETVDELCDIRTKYGSLEGFLQIDMLNQAEGSK